MPVNALIELVARHAGLDAFGSRSVAIRVKV